ncbi:MAG: M4 family metallopeptidase [Bacteroidia bacterium]
MKNYTNNTRAWISLWLLLQCSLITMAQGTKSSDSFGNTTLEQIALPTSTERFLDLRTDAKINPSGFFKNYGVALGLTKSDDMRLNKIQTEDNGFTNYRFNQYYRNVHVEGAEFIVHANDQGYAYSANGELVKDLNQTTMPVLSIDDARQKAMQHIGAEKYLWENSESENRLKESSHNPDTSYFPKGELIWTRTNYNEGVKPENYQLAYTFDIHCFSPLKSIRIVISAVDGKIIKEENMSHNCTTLTNAPNPFYTGTTCKIQWTGSNYRLYDDCQTGYIWVRDWNSTSLTSNPIEIADASGTNWNSQVQTLGTATMWALETARNYYSNTFSRNGWNNLNGNIDAYVNARFDANSCAYPFVTYSEDNASFNRGTGVCLVGSGCNVSGNSDSYATIDIIGHEFTHGVTGTSVTGGLAYQGESGALDESFSDIFGEMVEKSALGSCDYLNGNDRQDAVGNHTPSRSLSNPNDHNQPDTYGGLYWINTVGCVPTGGGSGNDYCGVHTNSGVQNYMFYLLSEGGSGTNDAGNGFSVSGITNNAASAIAYRVLNGGYLTSNATYADARAAWVNAAKYIYGNCSNEAYQTAKAWFAVGVGSLPFNYNENVCGNLAAITYGAVISATTCSTGATALSGITSNITGNDITLSPGFTATSGCNFRAYVTPCNSAIARPSANNTGAGQLVKTIQSVNKATDMTDDNSIKISPNPFRNNFTLDINLTEDAQVSVTIYDMMGNEVDHVIQNQAKQKGLVQLQYKNEKLPANIYMCVIEINGKRYTEKMVKL